MNQRNNIGFNAQVGVVEDLHEIGIVDSSVVVARAVRNAIGISSTILTSDSIVYIPELTSDEMQYQIAMKQANPFQQ